MNDERDMPADPWSDPARPYSSALDEAHTLRLALLELPDMAAVFAALSALTDDECRMLVLELAMDSWWERHHRGQL